MHVHETFRWAISACLFFAPALTAQAQIPVELENAYLKANLSVQAKEFDKADQVLQEAVGVIDKLPADERYPPKKELQAGLMLRRGQVLMHEDSEVKRLSESLKIFEEIATSQELGSPKQKAVAQVNAAAVMMRLNRPKEAVELMQQCNWDLVEAGQKHILYYNYARALEESGRAEDAMIRYARSLANDPDFGPAREQLERLLRERRLGQSDESGKLIERVVNEGAGELVLALSADALVQQSSMTPEAVRLLPIVTIALAHGFETQERFGAKYNNVLNRLADSPWKTYAEEIRLLTSEKFVDASFEVGFDGHAADASLRSLPWCSQRRLQTAMNKPLAEFLKKTAQPYLNQPASAERSANRIGDHLPQEQQSFVRIYSAWLLKPNDLELGRLLAYVTQKASKSDLYRMQAREKLVDSMIHQKGEIYRLQGKTIEDWENILLMHTVLGTVFEADNQCDDARTGIRSGIAQWRYAINAEDMIRKLQQKGEDLKHEQLYHAPGLHEHLAKCLQATERKEEAFDSYIKAANGYLSMENVQAASRMLEAAVVVNSGSEQARTQLDSLRAAIHAAQQR